jgi:hypothetical protein
MTKVMEDKSKIVDELLGKAAEYGRTEFELIKLKALDKTTDVVSTFIPPLVIIAVASIFMLFLNLGIAFWLGGVFGNIYYGFFAVAAFYGITALVLRLFMYKWLKKRVGDYIVRKVLK